MADKKISELTDATTPLTGAELVPLDQLGATRKATVADIALAGGFWEYDGSTLQPNPATTTPLTTFLATSDNGTESGSISTDAIAGGHVTGTAQTPGTGAISSLGLDAAGVAQLNAEDGSGAIAELEVHGAGTFRLAGNDNTNTTTFEGNVASGVVAMSVVDDVTPAATAEVVGTVDVGGGTFTQLNLATDGTNSAAALLDGTGSLTTTVNNNTVTYLLDGPRDVAAIGNDVVRAIVQLDSDTNQFSRFRQQYNAIGLEAFGNGDASAPQAGLVFTVDAWNMFCNDADAERKSIIQGGGAELEVTSLNIVDNTASALDLHPEGSFSLTADDGSVQYDVTSGSNLVIMRAQDGGGHVAAVSVNGASASTEMQAVLGSVVNSFVSTVGGNAMSSTDGTHTATVSTIATAFYFSGNGLTAAPADGVLGPSVCALWLDPTPGATKLMVKAKDSGGTVRTAAIALT